MSMQKHMLFWAVIFFVFGASVMLLKGVLMPFVVGLAVAYLLNPLVSKIERRGVPRYLSSLLILGVFYLALMAALAVVAPLVYRESIQIYEDYPGYLDRIMTWVQPYIEQARSWVGHSNGSEIKELLAGHSDKALGAGNVLLSSLALGGQALGSMLALLIIAPLTAYFSLKEWPSITKWGEGLLPRKHKNTIIQLLSEMNSKISGFVRGQITVALILGTGYALALSLMGLKYGLLIGFSAGIVGIIPFFGATFGFVTGGLVAWFQTQDLLFVGQILAVFAIGQLIEGNLLTPKLVGDSVGLHPIWVIFALMAGGALFGILGMLLAVPVAAMISVLFSFAIAQYKSSAFYKDNLKPKTKKKRTL